MKENGHLLTAKNYGAFVRRQTKTGHFVSFVGEERFIERLLGYRLIIFYYACICYGMIVYLCQP